MSTAVLERPIATTVPAPAPVTLAVGDRVALRRNLSHPTWVNAALRGEEVTELVGYFHITAVRGRRQYATVGGQLVPTVRTELRADAGLWFDAETLEAVGPKLLTIAPAPTHEERKHR